MKILLALLVLTVLALAGSRRVLFDRHVPLGARLIFLTGTEFIIVGFLLGSHYIGLLDKPTLVSLSPITAVCLGWVGLMFGMQFELRALRSLPRQHFAISVGQALFTMAILFVGFLFLFQWFISESLVVVFPAAITLAAAGACSGQAGLSMIQRRFPGSDRSKLTLLRYLSGIDALPAIVVFGVVTSLGAREACMLSSLGGIPRLGMGVALASLLGLVLYSLARERTSKTDLLLLLMALCAVCGGMARQIGISVLFLAMIVGVIVANLSPLRARMSEVFTAGERFIYLVLLVLAGASWELPSLWAIALAGAYVLLRIAAKTLGTYVATRPLTRHVSVPPLLGLGLTSQAGMALAIVIDFLPDHRGKLGFVVLTVAVMGIIVNELIGPFLAVSVVGGRRELSEDES